MDKNDYKTEFEEQRQEIKLEDENNGEVVASRTELHKKSNKPKKRSKHKLINMLLVLFTLIPIGILVYVFMNWNGSKESLNSEVEDPSIKIETNNVANGAGKKDSDLDVVTDDAKKEEPVKKEKPEPKPEKNPDPKPDPKPEPEPETKPDPEPETKPETKPDPKPDPKQDTKQDTKPEPTPTESNKTHIVASGETLYRISVKYYGNGNGVDKIRQANGLSSNTISVGQKIIVP